MHANDLRTEWQYSAKIRIDKTEKDHGHSPSNPVVASASVVHSAAVGGSVVGFVRPL